MPNELVDWVDLAVTQTRLLATVRQGARAGLLNAAPDGLRGLPGVRGGLDRGLQAYRLHGVALSEQSLAATYPTLRSLMEAHQAGSFAALAWSCWQSQGPTQADLGDWGGGLVMLLAESELIQGSPSAWTDAAHLDWARHCAERAPDGEIDRASLSLLETLPLDGVRLKLHASVRLVQTRGADGLRMNWMVWRQDWCAQARPVSVAVSVWIQALLDGHSLARSLLRAATASGPAFDVTDWLTQALSSGWLLGAEPISSGDALC